MSDEMGRVHVEATADSHFGTNSYLVEDEQTKDAVIVDANLEPEAMVELVRQRGSKVRALLLTHTDIDHVAGVARLRQEFPDMKVAVHVDESHFLREGEPLRGASLNLPVEPVPEAEELREGEVYAAGSIEMEVLHTPGHSPGGITFRIGNVLFTGDALFAGSVGRTDLPGGDQEVLLRSIREKLMTHGDEYLVLSGHGPVSTIGQERRYNPFL